MSRCWRIFMLSLLNHTVCIHIFNALLASKEELEVEKEDEPRSNGNDRRHGKGGFFTVSRLCVSQARLAYPRGRPRPGLLSKFRRFCSITFVLGVRCFPLCRWISLFAGVLGEKKGARFHIWSHVQFHSNHFRLSADYGVKSIDFTP